MLTHGNLLASCEALRLAWRWTAERPARARAAALPRARARRRAARHAARRRLGRAAPGLRRRDVLDATRDARRHACSSGCRRCTPARRRARGSRSWPGCGCACRDRRRCRRRSHDELAPRAGPVRARALRDDRDHHERVEPLRRRAARRARWASRSRASSVRLDDDVGRDPAAGTQRVPRLLGPRGGDADAVHRRRVVPQRRRRRHRPRRLPPHRRAGQGADHLRRLQRVSPRGRGRPAPHPGGGGGRGRRRAVGRVGRGGRRRRRARDRRARPRRPARVRGRAPRALQAPAPGAVRRRAAAQRAGQGPPREL